MKLPRFPIVSSPVIVASSLAAASLSLAAPARAREVVDPNAAFTDKGRVVLGGGFNYNHVSGDVEVDGDSVEIDGTTIVGGNLLAGFFVAEQFMLAASVGFETRSQESADGDREQSTTVGYLEAVPRYYVTLSAAKAAFFVLEASLGYGSQSTETVSDGDITRSSSSGFMLGAGAGLAAVVGGGERGAVVDLMLRVRKSFFSGDDGFDSETAFDLTTIGIGLGISAYF
ncbi:MAG: outer membrane beta-barrel protein [Deltaproteobacteria bacterium]|jgi:hypothetical protein|nr:outer membrane beta-barrel protein [Deltaproteobacteria bacterium]